MKNQDENNTHGNKKGDQTSSFDADCHGSLFHPQFALPAPSMLLALIVFIKSKPCGNEKR
jgi:hypothetical protein